MDQWATPLVVSSLINSRDGTAAPITARDKLPRRLPAQPDDIKIAGQKARLKRWDPWVRVNLCVNEVLRQLDVEPVKRKSNAVCAVTLRRSDKPLVKLSRPDNDYLLAQLPLVESWADLRDERALEILAQIDNQYAFIAAVTGLNVDRHKRTVEWLTVVIQVAIAIESVFKHVFACPRPVELSPQIQPIITTPGHGSYPMGHAAQAFATAVALAGLRGAAVKTPLHEQLMMQATRISINRVVAGVHFPVDAPAGQVLGMSLGELMLALSGVGKAKVWRRTFAPGDKPAEEDYSVWQPKLGETGVEATGFAPLPMLSALARTAADEW